MANLKPSPPTDVKLNGVAESPDMATSTAGPFIFQARVDDPNAGQKVRLWVSIEIGPLSVVVGHSGWVNQGSSPTVNMGKLSVNTRYKAFLSTQDELGKFSTENVVTFWTNRSPNIPGLVSPLDNSQFSTLAPVAFDWNYSDPDGGPQNRYELRWRTAPTPTKPAGAWTTTGGVTTTSAHTQAAGTYKANTDYEWQVRTRDNPGLWSGWSLIRSFYAIGGSSAPRPLNPSNGEAVIVTDANPFSWDFRDPDAGDSQTKADIRYRAVGTVPWFDLFGSTTTPGSAEFWDIPPDTFIPGVNYEWQVRTYDLGSGGLTPSDWSTSAYFWSIGTPGSAILDPVIPEIVDIKGTLGCGQHRVFIYDRGGMVPRGEITPLASIVWGRRRDDIAVANFVTNGFGLDCGELLAELECWHHELVVFRDDERVFEGPITRLTYMDNEVRIEARDVMAYVYRRIMRQGYNDSYHVVKGKQLGLTTVVDRAARIIINAMAYLDPNVLPYLTIVRNSGDARQSRVMPDYSKTAWEEVDDLAANAGLDYTTVGRRIILWDTHRAIGRLPEMRDEHFSDPPIVSQYGMSMSNYFAVTNGNGVWGDAYPKGTRPPDAPGFQPMDPGGAWEFYGPVEMLASSYGESDGSATSALTPTARAKMVEAMKDQAERNINNRWPAPLVVRVPDNSTIHPDTIIGINQLVPGAWVPLRSTGLRPFSQWQKLDSVTVEETNDGERVKVVMSPAPNGGDDDPDATPSEET